MNIAAQHVILIKGEHYCLLTDTCISNEASDSIYLRVIYCLFFYTLLKDRWPFIL